MSGRQLEQSCWEQAQLLPGRRSGKITFAVGKMLGVPTVASRCVGWLPALEKGIFYTL